MLTNLIKAVATRLGLRRSDPGGREPPSPGPQPRGRDENDWVRRLQRSREQKR